MKNDFPPDKTKTNNASNVAMQNEAITSEPKSAFSQALTNCMEPLLKGMNWLGEKHHIVEAYPYMREITNETDFIKTLNALHFKATKLETSLAAINEHFLPCLFITDNKDVYVLLRKVGYQIQAFDGMSSREVSLGNYTLSGTVYIFKSKLEDEKAFRASRTPWFNTIMKPYYPVFRQAFFTATIIGILNLAIPLFSLEIYDKVIPTSATITLASFFIGVMIALLGSSVLQWLHSRILIVSTAKVVSLINNSIFERLVYLAPTFTENASVNAQVARIKDFDNIRDFMTSPLFRMFFEIPFIVIGLLVIALLGGWLVFIPITTLILYGILFLTLKNKVHETVEHSAQASNVRQDMLLESLYSMRALKYCNGEDTWFNRYRDVSSEATIKNFRASILTNAMNITLDTIMLAAGFLIISFGAVGVVQKTLTVGALIATMMLAWRILAPVKALFASQTRIDQFFASIQQVNTLMNILPERETGVLIEKIKGINGNVLFNRVTFRYPNTQDLALNNVTFEAKKGEVITLAGQTGSGKTTILKLMLALYPTLGGTILLDNHDIRQLDPVQLRFTLGYVPQSNDVFYGTVLQNLLLAKPTATKEEINFSIQRADINEEIASLPKGLDTRVDDQSFLHLSPGFLQRLSLARTYLKKPPIILFDEPTTTLDIRGEQALLKAIEYFRGYSTIFMVTHRPSILKVADKILLLNQGQLIISGPTSQVLSKIPLELI